MATWRATYTTTASITVDVDAPDEDAASDMSWEAANAYLNTLLGDVGTRVSIDVSLDGIGADTVTEV